MIWKTDAEYIRPYLTDASNSPGGIAEAVFIPETQEELIAFVKDNFNNKKLPLTIAGRRTGLCGGCIPQGGVVISTERLNKIGTILPLNNGNARILVEPGAILGDIQQYTAQHAYLYPPDPTERGCSIGGAIVHNSSGARTFQYGPTRPYVESLYILLANGDTLRLRRGEQRASDFVLHLQGEQNTYIISLPDISMPAIKHAAGYYIHPDVDAIDLFIGSEGTLGIILEAELRLIPAPENLFAGIIFFTEQDQLLEFVEKARLRSQHARQHTDVLDIQARALEYFDPNALNLVRHAHSSLPENIAGAIWFEQEITAATEEKLLELWYELISEHTPLVEESWFAVTEKEQERLRAFRHSVPASIYERVGEQRQTKIGTDMAVPDEHFREFFHFYLQEFSTHNIDYVIFGHIGNCHVHANMFVETPEQRTTAIEVYKRCVKKAISLGGTVSAEHGIGKIKRQYLQEMYGSGHIAAFRNIKQILDPEYLLNVGTMFEKSDN